MTLIAATNILLISLCIFTMLLVWQRNRRRKQIYLAKLMQNPETAKWLAQNLSGNEVADIKAVRVRFGLPILESKKLIDTYRSRKSA